MHYQSMLEVKPAKQEFFLESAEYKNEVWDIFDSSEDFMTDLRNHHNKP